MWRSLYYLKRYNTFEVKKFKLSCPCLAAEVPVNFCHVSVGYLGMT